MEFVISFAYQLYIYKFIGFIGELHITSTKWWTELLQKNYTVVVSNTFPALLSQNIVQYVRKKCRKKSNKSKRRSRIRDR